MSIGINGHKNIKSLQLVRHHKQQRPHPRTCEQDDDCGERFSLLCSGA